MKEVEELEDSLVTFICPHCNEQVEVISPINGHHFTCYECGRTFEIDVAELAYEMFRASFGIEA